MKMFAMSLVVLGSVAAFANDPHTTTTAPAAHAAPAAAHAEAHKAVAAAKDMMAACKNDSMTLCKGMTDKEKVSACLKENMAKLSPACKETMPKM